MSARDQHRKLKNLFDEARGLDAAARRDFLDEHCAGDDALRAQLEHLLEADADAANPIRAIEPTPLPTQIGPYRVVRLIGEGGMGTVVEAIQDNPRRRVAVKILSGQAASPQLLRRFEHEAHILGRLQHPGIAQVFEAGTFDTGMGAQPYYSMEFIKGEPLDEFCRHHDLSTRQRLYLIAKICEAVEYAHGHGVIHRDLKPANILVDRRGQIKILDFGVARVTGGDMRAVTLQTNIGQLVGTIPYMSPEQAAGDPAAIDHRSDVYALGVLAYELLADRLPYRLNDVMVHEAVRIIREVEPTPLGIIDRAHRGDVETIVAKALDKDKTRRYQAARDLGYDIRNFLGDAPISARPRSTSYHVGKYVRRHRVAVATSTLASLVVVTAAIAVGVLWRANMRLHDEVAMLRQETRDREVGAAAVAAAVAPEVQTPAPDIVIEDAEPVTSGAPDEPTDVPPPPTASNPPPRPLPSIGDILESDDWTWETPVHVGDLFRPVVGTFPDDVLLLVNLEPDAFGHHDIVRYARPDPGSPWTGPHDLGPDFNTPANELWPWLSNDGLTLLFSTNAGGHADILRSTRPSTDASWPKPIVLGPAVNSPAGEIRPVLSEDGLTLVFTSNRPSGYGETDLYECRRAAPDDPWSDARSLGPRVNSAFKDEWPILFDDGNLLLLSSNRQTGSGPNDVLYCRRSGPDDPWSLPRSLGLPINTPNQMEAGNWIHRDGRDLVVYFYRHPEDFYSVRRVHRGP